MKKILIALCGKHPQIITETLYALHGRQSFPDRAVILTTEEGRARCLHLLLDPEHGRLPALLQSLRRSAPRLLRAEDILTPPGPEPVPDIHTEEDSRRFLELCLSTVFRLSREQGSELVFSIAGGRKTMSAALVLAAQCYARPQDSMFHILVPQELEGNPAFFYPDGRQDSGVLTLTPVPFFRMREHLPPGFLQSPGTLESLSYVCMPQKPLQLMLDHEQRSLSCEGKSLRLPPSLFAVYAFFARQQPDCPANHGLCPETCSACAMTWPEVAAKLNDILRIYETLEEKPLARGQTGIVHLSAENFRSSLAKLKRSLIQAFGPATGMRLCIVSLKSGHMARYCLRLPRTQIFTASQRCNR